MINQNLTRILGAGLTVICGLFLIFPAAVEKSDETYLVGISEEDYLRSLNECTTGIASGLATPDGKPLLWKNRDVGRADQEYQYYDDGRIPFISLTYSNETDEYYGGVNAAGFAVENSNSYNLPHGPGRNGFGYGDDDGFIHAMALATCRTVDDFGDLLDSLHVTGITLNSNYGTFDAFGGAAMFEVAGYSFVRHDAADTPDGFIVRSNYSYSGRGLNNRANYWGPHRHDKAYQLFKRAVDDNNLTPKYMFQQVIRNLSIDGTDPHPLPFDGYVGNSPYGCIPNGEAICRSSTKGVFLAQGVRDGERPDDAIIWAMVGNQLGTVPVPLWVRAGSVPEEMDSENGSRINIRGRELSSWIYNGGAVDTWKLTNEQGTGVWDYTFPLEDWIFTKVDRFIDSPNFDYDQLETFQNTLARQVADSLDNWRPTFTVTADIEPGFGGGNILIAWGDQIDNVETPRAYAVFRSEEPFREGVSGDRIALVNETEFTDENPLPGGAFYRVEARYN